MSAANENHEPVPVEELQDRLLDTALAELVGGRVPPDFTERILEARDMALSTTVAPAASGGRWRHIKWISMAVAATLLVSAITWLSLESRSLQFARSRIEIQETHSGVDEYSNKSGRRKDRYGSQDLGTHKSLRQHEAKSRVVTSDGSAKTPGQEITKSDAEDVADTILTASDAAESASSLLSLDVSGPAGPEGGSGAAAVPGFAPRNTTIELYSLGDAPSQQSPAREFYFEQQQQQQAGRGAARTKTLSTSLAAGGKIVNAPHPMKPQSPALQPSSSDEIGLKLLQSQVVTEGRDDLYALDDQRGLQRAFRQGSFDKENPPEVQLRADFDALDAISSGDKYTPINENAFIKAVGPEAVSTFSIDVDTASYSNVRQFLMQMNQLPPANAVRIEELVNYFQYDYQPPTPIAPGSAGGSDDVPPFAAHVEVAGCPWNNEHRLARIAVKGREMDRAKRPLSNLVFLVDVSGSMNEPAKLPLVVYGLEQLTMELGENDHIAIVVYAGSEGLALPSTSGSKQDIILATLGKLQAGGSTAGGAGINLAYQIAEDNFIKGGTNRVILCTDGDFNVGVTDTGELQKLVEKKAKDTGVFLSVLGFGRGNLNDAMMESISNHGNGNYHYVDNRTEARRVLVEQMTGTLVTIAKDVKIQVEFNPGQVTAYRLIGYEDRMLRTEDFNDDKKDAGEIGAGHNVTALYEVVPAGKKIDSAPVDELKYQKPVGRTILSDQSKPIGLEEDGTDTIVRPTDDASKELLTLKMRYKAPDGDTSKKLEWSVTDGGMSYGEATDDYQFASAVAGFGMLLRDSKYKGDLTFAAVLELAQSGLGADERGYRKEFLELVKEAKKLKGE